MGRGIGIPVRSLSARIGTFFLQFRTARDKIWWPKRVGETASEHLRGSIPSNPDIMNTGRNPGFFQGRGKQPRNSVNFDWLRFNIAT